MLVPGTQAVPRSKCWRREQGPGELPGFPPQTRQIFASAEIRSSQGKFLSSQELAGGLGDGQRGIGTLTRNWEAWREGRRISGGDAKVKDLEKAIDSAAQARADGPGGPLIAVSDLGGTVGWRSIPVALTGHGREGGSRLGMLGALTRTNRDQAQTRARSAGQPTRIGPDGLRGSTRRTDEGARKEMWAQDPTGLTRPGD